ncbi:myc target protein 1 homolog isoform X2 [Tachysurus vachellii]|uniref:myc target protein 1 homolog isoform X2 n=1 Tax=Tachysurus vachellii TaxID=175792 RepID=UPI00296ABB2C|nr:myc target protein 1 homolog isoform X2 [Tachysurus vachellii]
MCISAVFSSVSPNGAMAGNSTHPILEILQSFSTRLLLGALVYVVLTWMARRRASATITRMPSPRSSGRPSSPRTRPLAFSRQSSAYDRRSNNSLASAAYTFHRQTSSSPIDHSDLLGRKDSFRASTFHPLIQCSQIAREAEEGNHGTLSSSPGGTITNSTASSMVTPPRHRPRPNSFWGNSSLGGISVTQTPPPAYNSIIRAYQETCT